jgi:hypothetical protein
LTDDPPSKLRNVATVSETVAGNGIMFAELVLLEPVLLATSVVNLRTRFCDAVASHPLSLISHSAVFTTGSAKESLRLFKFYGKRAIFFGGEYLLPCVYLHGHAYSYTR